MRPDASIQEAAEKIRALNVGALPVYDGRELSGTITDRDLTVRATAGKRDPKTTPRERLPKELGDDLRFRRSGPPGPLMMQKEICQLPVLSHDKKFVGMVTLDLARKTAPVQTGQPTPAISSWG